MLKHIWQAQFTVIGKKRKGFMAKSNHIDFETLLILYCIFKTEFLNAKLSYILCANKVRLNRMCKL